MNERNEEPTPCWIYRSAKKQEMYLYLNKEDDFQAVPPALRELFGAPSLVMQIDLHAGRKLAREDVGQVIENLRARGFHLQMPPDIRPQIMHS